MSLFATTGYEAVLARVDKRVHTFLMQVECLMLLILQVLDGVDVNETVQRGRNYVVEIFEVFNTCNPSLVALRLNELKALLD